MAKKRDILFFLAMIAAIAVLGLFIVNIDRAFPTEGASDSFASSIARQTAGAPAVNYSDMEYNSDAKVTIVEFSNFQCPYCGRAAGTMQQITGMYSPDEVSIVFKHSPSNMQAAAASEAAECARDQGMFWQYHDMLFDSQGRFSTGNLQDYAQSLGLDMDEFDLCIASDEKMELIKSHMQEASDAGIRGTPTFFVNGRAVIGAQPLEAFTGIIEEELAK